MSNEIREYYERKPFNEQAYKAYLRAVHAEDFVLSYLLTEGNKILRTRVNEDCKFFRKIENISYPHPNEKAHLNRASIEGKPMFYGSIFTHKANEPFLPRLINLMETSEFFCDKESVGRRMLTQSAWINRRSLKLAILPPPSAFEQPSDELVQIQKDFETISQNGVLKFRDEAYYLGNLFAQDGDLPIYNMTAYYVDYLLNESKDRDYFDGVVYPSVPGKGLGMNICIKPSLIDDNVVKFSKASMCMLVKDKMQCKLSQLFDADVSSNGDLLWYNSDALNMAIESPHLFDELLYIQ